MIPRIIHQVWLGGQVPAPLALNVQTLRTLNPDWEHRLWGEAEAEAFVRDRYGARILKHYRRINPQYGAARADLLRHLILATYGGVYFDMKSGASVPLSFRDDDSYIIAQWPAGHPCAYPHPELASVAGGEYVNWFLASEAGHPFSFAAIEQITRQIDAYRPWSAVGRTGTLRTTGPIPYTLALQPILKKHSHRFIDLDDYGIYYSIDYDNRASGTHYSELKSPVVHIGAIGSSVSRALNLVR